MFDARLIQSPVIEIPENLSTESMKSFSFAARFVRAMRGCVALAAVLLLASGSASAATPPPTANYVAIPTAVNTTAVIPVSVAVDSHGNIFYLDIFGSCPGVSELAASNGVVSTSTVVSCLPMPSGAETYANQQDVAVDNAGNVYVADDSTVYKVALDSNGKISSSSVASTLITKTGSQEFVAVAVDASGNLYIGDEVG